MSMKKPQVFLDVSIDGDPYERMIFELFTDVVPKTAENFRALCTGEKGISLKTGKPLHYKGTFFHHIVKGHLAQGGDFLRQNGNFGESIYEKFPDESSKLKHDGPGLLSMSIADREERGSLFSVTLNADRRLDRKYVVFGKLVNGHEVLKKIENAGSEDGRSAVTVKIVNSGELHSDKKMANNLKMGKDTKEENNHEIKRKGKHKKSSKKRKKRRYYTSESDSSKDSDSVSSESDGDSDTSLSDTSSSSDDRRKKRKRSKRDRHRHGKRKERQRGKRHKRQDKKSKSKSKRSSVSSSESDSSSSEDGAVTGALDRKHKNSGNQPPLNRAHETATVDHKNEGEIVTSDREERGFPRENGVHQSNGIRVDMKSERNAGRHPDVVDYLPSKSRSRSLSPRKSLSKSMSVSPEKQDGKIPGVSPKHYRSRSRSFSRSPPQISHRSRSNSPAISRSNSPAISRSKSPTRSLPRSKNGRYVSRSPSMRSPQRNRSRSATVSPRRRISHSPPKRSSLRSPSRSLVRSSRPSFSRSPAKSSRKSVSRSPIKSTRTSASRSSGRAPNKRTISPSPVRAPSRTTRRSYSRSPVPADRRARSPVSDRSRSSSRSPSADGSPKRIKRGRGFSDRYSYVRRYRSRSPDRSPVRSYRYGGRGDRDRYPSYRRSPRRYRSPPRGRTPPRYRGRRSRTRSHSISRSPIRNHNRNRRRSRSRTPILHSSSPVERRRGSPPPSGSIRCRSRSLSSRDSRSPRNADKGNSSSQSPPRKAALVSYGGNGSPDSGCS